MRVMTKLTLQVKRTILLMRSKGTAIVSEVKCKFGIEVSSQAVKLSINSCEIMRRQSHSFGYMDLADQANLHPKF